MDYTGIINTKINDKVKLIKTLTENLSTANYRELKIELWEIERETTLLREYIEKNFEDEELRDVV